MSKHVPALVALALIVCGCGQTQETATLHAPTHSGFTEALARSTFYIFPLENIEKASSSFVLFERVEGDSIFEVPILFTAKHVLNHIKDDKAKILLRSRQGNRYMVSSSTITIRDEGKPLWVEHPQVDAAALSLSAWPDNADVGQLSTEYLADDNWFDRTGFSIGSPVHVLGFPLGGRIGNAYFPILRGGTVSSFPLTPSSEVPTFMIDAPIMGGNSGGPVISISDHGRVDFEQAPVPSVTPMPRHPQRIVGLVFISQTAWDTFLINPDSLGRPHSASELKMMRPLDLAGVISSQILRELIDQVMSIELAP